MKATGIVASVCLAASMSAGCSTTFKPAAVDAMTGRYVIQSKIPAEHITVRKAFNVDSTKKMVFIRTNLGTVSKWDTYFETSIKNIGFFEQVMRKDDFERKLVQDNKSAEVPSVDGFSGLAGAARVYGDFLLIDFDLTSGAGYQVDAKMTVYNAANAEELLKVEHGITNWGGLDSTLFQPVFNILIDWLDENSPTFPATKTASVESEKPK